MYNNLDFYHLLKILFPVSFFSNPIHQRLSLIFFQSYITSDSHRHLSGKYNWLLKVRKMP